MVDEQCDHRWDIGPECGCGDDNCLVVCLECGARDRACED